MTSFGHYQLLQRVGVGGMAEVFLGRTAAIDGFERIVTIKRMREKLNANPRFFSLFIEESRIASALSHPNIVEVFDFGAVEGAYYMAIEYVSGCDLGAVLALDGVRSDGLDPNLSLFITREVLGALHYAHTGARVEGQAVRVVHRDVSPANILLSFRGKVKITDFGVAHAEGSIAAPGSGMLVGKLPYMAPEQVTDKAIDARTDVFAAGLVLWELLVGRPAYCRDRDNPVLKEVRKARLPPPSKYNSRIPQNLDELVLGALAPRPKHRYSEAREFQRRIDTYFEETGAALGEPRLVEFLQENREELTEIVHELRGESLADFVAGAPAPAPAPAPAAALPPELESAAAAFKPAVAHLMAEFLSHPNLWRLVEMARLTQKDDADSSLTFWRAAAVRFAQSGLLAQSLLCVKGMLALRPLEELRPEIERLPDFVTATDDEIVSYLGRGVGPAGELLPALLPVGGTAAEVPEGTALLSYIGGEAFADLANAVVLRHFEEGEHIVEEGQSGNTMYLIGQGRVVIYVRGSDHRRVYLSSLMAGEFFGEHSFFTGAPRSATVQAVHRSDVFEIDPDLAERVLEGNPNAGGIMIRFYKQRIVETLVAKSRILGLLPRPDRRALVDKLRLRVLDPGEVLIAEGRVADEIFLVKAGQADVHSEKGGESTHLACIGPGAIVGEVAALRRIPRTASIRATTRLEVLRLAGDDFLAALEARPEIKSQVYEEIAQRVRENLDRIGLHTRPWK